MKKLSLFVVVLLVSGTAFATCPTPPFFCNYSQDQSCYTGSGNVSNATADCFGFPSFSFGSGTGYRQASFTIGANDCILNPNRFDVTAYIDFDSPGGTSLDNFEIDADVTHPNNTVSRYTILYWSGAYGSLSTCDYHATTGYFPATHGDTVTVYIRGTNSGNAKIKISVPYMHSNN